MLHSLVKLLLEDLSKSAFILENLGFCICTGCKGGIGQGKLLGNGLGSGGGHGGQGGMGCYEDSCIEGGATYGDADLPCELGSGSGNDSLAMSTTGGGVLGWLKFTVE